MPNRIFKDLESEVRVDCVKSEVIRSFSLAIKDWGSEALSNCSHSTAFTGYEHKVLASPESGHVFLPAGKRDTDHPCQFMSSWHYSECTF